VLWSEIGITASEVWAEMDRRQALLGMAEKLPKEVGVGFDVFRRSRGVFAGQPAERRGRAAGLATLLLSEHPIRNSIDK
jgi:hypothetical protein